VLGLIAFILAFTFGIVSGRYDFKKSLVREEANTVRTVWFRSDFLPDTDRVATKKMLIEYVDTRLNGMQSRDELIITQSLIRCEAIHQQIWDIAVKNGKQNLNSDVGALYLESLNELINIHYTRVIVSLYSRVPMGIWFILMTMISLGMLIVGYMSAIAGSKRSWGFVILAFSFALVVGMVYTMDKLYSPFTPISQFAMEQLLEFMKLNQ
ncbi:MAG TPA: hypothetical protein VFF90_04500, partial [Saprospiraceae bacterium]|nr:hypothetical protein [Saprospiraceae bacterium]